MARGGELGATDGRKAGGGKTGAHRAVAALLTDPDRTPSPHVHVDTWAHVYTNTVWHSTTVGG